MRYQDHPTWQMLEKSKQEYKAALNTTPKHHPYRIVIEEAHITIVKLQLALEDKLLREMSDES